MSRGYVLVEVSVAYIILAFALTALLPVFILSVKAGANTTQLQVATYLSEELLEEVRLRKWDESTPTSTRLYTESPSNTLGTDAGETASDKTTFDDVDDFNGWSESGARDPLNRVLADLAAYRRSVTVSYVDSTLTASAGATDFKMVQVCTQTSKINPLCLQTVLTNH